MGIGVVEARELPEGFTKQMTGVWSPLPFGSTDDFTRPIIQTAVARCATPGPLFVEYRMVQNRLVRLSATGEDAVVLDVRSGAARGEFTTWLVATSSKIEAIVLGRLEISGKPMLAMVTEARNYVRCPAPVDDDGSTERE